MFLSLEMWVFLACVVVLLLVGDIKLASVGRTGTHILWNEMTFTWHPHHHRRHDQHHKEIIIMQGKKLVVSQNSNDSIHRIQLAWIFKDY